MEYSLKDIINKAPAPKEAPDAEIADKRHMDMLDAIAPYAKKSQQKNMTPIYVDYKTRETKLMLVLCPQWAAEFPPFNLARLSGVAKSAGYETSILDLNVRTFRLAQDDWEPNGKTPFRLWDAAANWHWTDQNYYEFIHHLVEPILEKGVQEILDADVDVVGFTMYYISEEPTKWMARELKRRKPGIKIIVGGSSVQKSYFTTGDWYDYAVAGEGEGAILKILDEIEEGVEHDEAPFYTQEIDERININGMPMPDYASIDFTQYRIPNGVNTEFSRGCTAKCTFCEETHFWRFRQRQAVDLLTEIEWLYYNKGTDVFWFIDSLVNGDLKELRAFCKAVVAKGLDIHWTGYARCDGKMDREYFEDLAAGGCIMFNYGCESGSQNVLNDMSKGVTVEEMEQNFRDGHAVGISASTNWIVGFPTETPNDFTQTMQMMWRNRYNSINNFALGMGLSVGSETIIGQNPARFNISDHKYMDHWITEDLGMGGMHVLHRVKSISVFLDAMSDCTPGIAYPVRERVKAKHYEINFHDPDNVYEIEYEDFDYNIINPGINSYADTLVNEIWALLRTLWRVRGGFDITVRFFPELDEEEFGDHYGPKMFTGLYEFSIDDAGNWDADFSYSLQQDPSLIPVGSLPGDTSRKGPFIFQEVSRLQTNAARRARRLAKPAWDIEKGRGHDNFSAALAEEKYLNENIDFSFEYNYKNSGKWERYQVIETVEFQDDIIARG